MKDIVSKKMAKASLACIVLCVGLLWISKLAQQHDLLQAYALVFTSNIVMLVYLFGLRNYIKQLQNSK